VDADLDFRLLFESSPDILLVLLPDAPRFTMIAVTEARLAATLQRLRAWGLPVEPHHRVCAGIDAVIADPRAVEEVEPLEATAAEMGARLLLRQVGTGDGTARHDPLGYLQNRTVDWLDHQLAARELLPIDVANTALVIEHEYPRARVQEKARLKPILKGSIAFARKIDEAAACMYALQHEVLPAEDIPVQGRGRVAYWT